MLQNTKDLTAILTKAAAFVLTSITLPVSSMFNRKLGERFLSIPRISIALISIPWLFRMNDLHLEEAKSLSIYRSNSVAILAFALIMLWQWIDTHDAIHHKGIKWHSRSPGVPWPWLGPDGKWQRLGVQPALCLAIAAVASHWSESLSHYFLVSSVLLLFGWLLSYAALRNRVLNMQDAILEQQAFAEILNGEGEGETTNETFGFPIQEAISPAERNNAPALSEIIKELGVQGSRKPNLSTPTGNVI